MKEYGTIHNNIYGSEKQHTKNIRSMFSLDEALLAIAASMHYVRSIHKAEKKEGTNEDTKKLATDTAITLVGKFLLALPEKEREGILETIKKSFGIHLDMKTVEEESKAPKDWDTGLH